MCRTSRASRGKKATTYEYLDVRIGGWPRVEPGHVVDCVAQVSTVARDLTQQYSSMSLRGSDHFRFPRF